jgi:hypothetical protein
MHRQAQVDLALRRLGRLANLEREYGHQLNAAGRRLLRVSTFSVYCDCRALGLADRAGLILGQLGSAGRSSPAPADLATIASV